MIDKVTVDKIIETAEIDEVISDFVNLKKRGANLLGLCPFHNEKTPSFTVSPAKGIYKCFGCGKAGNAVKFVMEHEHYSFPEALRFLAKKYNIEIEETAPDPNELAARDFQESLMVANSFALKFFIKQAQETEEGRNVALSYFKERGFRTEIIDKFELGYAPKRSDAFSEKALKNKFDKKILTEGGLSLERGGKLIDRFHERVIFPIHNQTGRPIAFAGRALSKKAKAKYINSPETELYKKNKVLYGLHLARTAMVKQDNCYLVEGYTDVISLHQSGIENVVASSGTSLTEGQIRLIRRVTKNITILYDGDEAGIKASFRGIDLILAEGMNVKVVLFPEGDDPDGFAQNHSSEELVNYLEENKKDFIEFKIAVLSRNVGDDPIKKSEMITELVESIAQINDRITSSVYIKKCAAKLDFPEAALYNELNKVKRKLFKQKVRKQQNIERQLDELPEGEKNALQDERKQINSSSFHQESDIIRIMLSYADKKFKTDIYNEEEEEESQEISVAQCVLYELFDTDEITFNNPSLKKILECYRAYAKKEKIPPSQFFTGNEDKDIAETAIGLLSEKYTISNWQKHDIEVNLEKDQLDKAVITAIFNLKLKKIEEKLNKIQHEIKSIDTEDEIEELLKSHSKLKAVQVKIAKRLGRVILR